MIYEALIYIFRCKCKKALTTKNTNYVSGLRKYKNLRLIQNNVKILLNFSWTKTLNDDRLCVHEIFQRDLKYFSSARSNRNI